MQRRPICLLLIYRYAARHAFLQCFVLMRASRADRKQRMSKSALVGQVVSLIEAALWMFGIFRAASNDRLWRALP